MGKMLSSFGLAQGGFCSKTCQVFISCDPHKKRTKEGVWGRR